MSRTLTRAEAICELTDDLRRSAAELRRDWEEAEADYQQRRAELEQMDGEELLAEMLEHDDDMSMLVDEAGRLICSDYDPVTGERYGY